MTKPSLDYLEAVIRRFLYLPEASYTLLPPWIVHTWVYEAFPCTPYLLVQSPTEGCGKTTLLKLLKAYCCNPRISSNGTAAALVRLISETKPTLIVDEWDALKPEIREMYFSLLNGGFEEGSVYIRCDGDDNKPREFPIYCPKCVAGVAGTKMPNTTLSRCLPFYMQPKPAGLRLDRLRRFSDEPARADLLAWAKEHVVALSAAMPAAPDGVSDRQLDLWEPLWAVCDALAEGDWPTRIRKLTSELDKATEKVDAPGVRLLAELKKGIKKQVSGEGAVCKVVSTKDLLLLSGLASPRLLAKALKPFNIKPATRRCGDEVFKGYLMSDFERAWAEHRVDLYFTEAGLDEDEGGGMFGYPVQAFQRNNLAQLVKLV